MKLNCENCNAKLTVDSARLIRTPEGAVVKAGFVIECQFCGTEHVAGTLMKRSGRTINTGGGAYVEGNIEIQGGDFVAGDVVLGDKIKGDRVILNGVKSVLSKIEIVVEEDK